MYDCEAKTTARVIGALPSSLAKRIGIGLRLLLEGLPGEGRLADYSEWSWFHAALQDPGHLLLADTLMRFLSVLPNLLEATSRYRQQIPPDQTPLVPGTPSPSFLSIRPSLLLENPRVFLTAGAHLVRLARSGCKKKELYRADILQARELTYRLLALGPALARRAAVVELMRSEDEGAFLRRLVLDYAAPSPAYDPTRPIPVLHIETSAGWVVQPFDESTGPGVLMVALRSNPALEQHLLQQIEVKLNQGEPPVPDRIQLQHRAQQLVSLLIEEGSRPLAPRSFALTPLLFLDRQHEVSRKELFAREIVAYWEQHQHRLSEVMLQACLQKTRGLMRLSRCTVVHNSEKQPCL